jgi:hypothetical protein
LNVHRVSYVRQMEIHTAEPLVPEPSLFEVEIGVTYWRDIDQILVELIKAEGEALHYEIINSLIPFGVRKNCLSSGRSLLLYQFARWAIKLSSNHWGISLLTIPYKILSSILSRLNPYVDKLTGDEYGFQCNRSTTEQMFCICELQEKKWECSETVYQLFMDFKKA